MIGQCLKRLIGLLLILFLIIFTTSELAIETKSSGINDNQIFYVGNTMIDTLLKNKSNFTKLPIQDEINLKNKELVVITLHRPAMLTRVLN